ncbi:MAG: class I SAM-dependent methyltransferase [Betaproteobacteria bacterium]
MEHNVYGRSLTPDEIAAGAHRDFVGGLWDEVGTLQFEFMRATGLQPAHRLLDMGCGALRGGLHFIRYLDAGHYCGMDINASLLDAGRCELVAAGLADKEPQLLDDSNFAAHRFGQQFDAAIAVSVFSHLPLNHIVRCLTEVGRVLAPGASFYASFFAAPASAWLEPLRHSPGEIVTRYDADPFHYGLAEMEWAAGLAGMRVRLVGDWSHPRSQQMLAFSLR